MILCGGRAAGPGALPPGIVLSLAVIVDGEVRSAPVIRDAVRGPANVVISASAEEAERLSELVRARWP